MRRIRVLVIVVLGILVLAAGVEWGLSYRRGTILEYHKPNVYFACTYTGEGVVGLQIEWNLAKRMPVGVSNKPGWNHLTTSSDAGIHQWYDSLAGPSAMPIKVGNRPFG